MVNSSFSHQSAKDFAAAWLPQSPGAEDDKRVASVRASRSTRRSGGDKKHSGSVMLGVMLAVSTCMVGKCIEKYLTNTKTLCRGTHF